MSFCGIFLHFFRTSCFVLLCVLCKFILDNTQMILRIKKIYGLLSIVGGYFEFILGEAISGIFLYFQRMSQYFSMTFCTDILAITLKVRNKKDGMLTFPCNFIFWVYSAMSWEKQNFLIIICIERLGINLMLTKQKTNNKYILTEGELSFCVRCYVNRILQCSK